MFKSRQFIALLIAVTLLCVNYLLGLIALGGAEPLHPEYASSAIVYPVLCAFLYLAYYSLKKSAEFTLAKTLSAGRVRTSKTLPPLVNKLIFRLHTSALVTMFSVACLASVAVWWFSLREHSLSFNYKAIALLIQTVPLWFLSMLILRLMLLTYLAVKKHLLHHQRLQLFEVNRLNTLSSFGFGVVMVYCGGLTIYAFNSIFVDFSIGDIVVLLIIFLLVISLMLAPGYVIVNKLREEKERELSLVNELIANRVHVTDKQPQRRLVDNSETLCYVSDLFIVRKSIQKTSTIPINIPAFSKLVVLLMLPVMSWFAAGMVSHLFEVVAR